MRGRSLDTDVDRRGFARFIPLRSPIRRRAQRVSRGSSLMNLFRAVVFVGDVAALPVHRLAIWGSLDMHVVSVFFRHGGGRMSATHWSAFHRHVLFHDKRLGCIRLSPDALPMPRVLSADWLLTGQPHLFHL